VQENLEREKTNKSQAISTRDTGDLFYRGSVLENLIPVEESTKDGSFSTLSLSPPITKTGELFFFVNKRPVGVSNLGGPWTDE
jgi:DNA mismatch repair ATPase MutL